jgi:hypothetical protein
MVEDLNHDSPSVPICKRTGCRTIRARVELYCGDAQRAIGLLQRTVSYELAIATPFQTGTLFLAYVRGNALLREHQGRWAWAEFQKVLDHRGIVLDAPIGALAHLGLGRAYVLQGGSDKARPAHQDFLTLWKNADPDIPILKQAKAEYAKLQ